MKAVDVLAVLDRLDAKAERARWAYSVRDDIAEVRAAMAELIEQQARTLELLEQAREKLELAHIREKAKWHKLYLSTAAQACAEHLPKVRAALTRVGGTK